MGKEWLIAMGLFLVFEGLLPALFPKGWKKVMSEAVENSDTFIRIMGVLSMFCGLAWIYWVH